MAGVGGGVGKVVTGEGPIVEGRRVGNSWFKAETFAILFSESEYTFPFECQIR
jgi:hypothetical protein